MNNCRTQTQYCGTICISISNKPCMIDIYENEYYGNTLSLTAFDGIDNIKINESDLNYLIRMGKVLAWKLREKYTAPSGRYLWR